jgi:hypothetical protein
MISAYVQIYMFTNMPPSPTSCTYTRISICICTCIDSPCLLLSCVQQSCRYRSYWSSDYVILVSYDTFSLYFPSYTMQALVIPFLPYMRSSQSRQLFVSFFIVSAPIKPIQFFCHSQYSTAPSTYNLCR